MRVLVDTNILVRMANKSDPAQFTARRAVFLLDKRGETLVVARQSIYEFWVVATRRQEKNGMGIAVDQAISLVEEIESTFPILAESDDIYWAWKKLVSDFKVSGKPGHDARLIALMQTEGISEVLSFNVSDFSRYQRLGISVLDPAEVIRTTSPQ